MNRMLSGLVMLAMLLAMTGCFTAATALTERTLPDGTKTRSKVSVVGTGDKVSQMAAEGLFADGSDEDLGAGVRKTSATQQSTGIDGAMNGAANMLNAGANLLSRIPAGGGTPAVLPPTVVTPSGATPSADGAVESEDANDALPAETSVGNAATLKSKIATAKATGKPLVVLAGNTGCGYCDRMDAALRASPAFATRPDIVFYAETSPWSSNQAAKWTGGGKYPVLRVTQWDKDGKIVCDKKVNRPQSVAALEAALGNCSIP